MLPAPESPLSHARAAIARAEQERRRKPDDPEAARRLVELRREYRVRVIEDRIRELVAAAPPLSDEQKRRLSTLLTAPAEGAA